MIIRALSFRIIFYSLLLSHSGHILFNASYFAVSASIVLMIALYTRSIRKNNLLTMMVAGLVTVFYGFLFVILQAQDYALLFGSVGLFLILGFTMYMRRKVD